MGFVEKEMLMYAVLIFVTGGKQGVGGISIRNCDNNLLDIRENTVTTIVCEGFNSSAIIQWTANRGNNSNELVATCISSRCYTANFDVRMTANESHLAYLQNDRDQDISTSIVCADTTIESSPTVVSCAFNVISWAFLSNCFIAYNSSTQTLKGSCNFDKAYSSNKSTSCTWFQNGQVPFNGTITPTYVSQQFTKGRCTFSINGLKSWTPGKHIYTILFYPSRGEKIVSKGNIAQSTTPTTTTTTTTISTTPVKSTTTKKPKMISLTTSFDGEKDGSPIELQRGQKAFLLTCRYDNTTGSAGHVSWCRTAQLKKYHTMYYSIL